ncbi:MAG TPA: DUF3618 domain-containing protein [Solirubrobacteraceae bacterium]|jgi:hypothetical protein|nr:DUF3618 domain-containing protein [Solirubrobacteraceae bacterium]
MAATRSTEEIRRSIEVNRTELGTAVEKLRGEVVKLTDWRGQLRIHQREVMIGAAAAGFLLAGGIAGVTGLLTRRKRRRG